jgi:hypothetical protein
VSARPVLVVLDGPPTPAWQASVLAGVDELAAFEVVELRLAGPSRRALAARMQDAAERHLFGMDLDPEAAVDVPGRPLRDKQASLVLWLSEQPPPSADGQAILTLRHDRMKQPVHSAFRRAMLADRSSVTSELLLSRQAASVLVAATVSEVRPFSETVSRSLALRKLEAMIPRALERLPGLDTPAAAERRDDRPLPGARMLRRAAASWVRAVGTRLVFRRPWSIRVRERAPSAYAWDQQGGLVSWGDARTYADPFLFVYEGRHHLFCEEVPRREKSGVISHTELSLDGTPAASPAPVLRRPYHLSYPFVFAHDGEVFMIPETREARRIELYRAVTFPHKWEREAILLDGIDAVDATIVAEGGRLWMFVGVAAPGSSPADELHLYFADVPTGPWRAHPCNPVVSDARCARPAGAIQRWNGRMVRPGQDCTRRYGWAISFREIDVLSPTAYAEHEIGRLEPDRVPGARAIHTYAATERFEAIDIRTRQPRWRAPRHDGDAH